MAAPQFVPTSPVDKPRTYESPDHVPEAWKPDRPAELTGGQLATVVQANADAAVTRDHGILQVSGLAYAFRENLEGPGAVVEEILVGGEALDAERTYTVALPDYVASMNDVYLGIDLPPLRETGLELAEVILAAVRAAGRIDSAVEGRMRALD